MARNPKQDANLRPIQKGELSHEEAKKRDSAGGKKSGEVRRMCRDAKKTIHYIMELDAVGSTKENLKRVGIPEEVCTKMTAAWVKCYTEWLRTGSIKLLEPLRHMNVEGYSATIFRKNAALITIDGDRALPEERSEKYGVEPELCKSVTFIASSVYDNKILLERDPSYLANLHGLSLLERERLLKGSWKIRPAAGYYFKRSKIRQMLSVIPADIVRWVRAWNLVAAVNHEDKDSACTAGVLMGKRKDGCIFVADVINVRENGADVRRLIKNTASSDNALYGNVTVRLVQDPGQAGKDQIQSFLPCSDTGRVSCCNRY